MTRTALCFCMDGRESLEVNKLASDDTRISKTLSYWLRHAPEAARLHLDTEGWTETDAVLSALKSAGLNVDRNLLRVIVSGSDKKRFELSDDETRLRARQGHSVQVDAGWVDATPPSALYHGTVDRFLEAILREGLIPGSRHHVHLSPDIETAKMVGRRRGAPIILEVAAGALAEEGEQFFLSTNGVWLVRHVPPTYLTILSVG